MEKNGKRILGLDLGTASIGWAYLELDEQGFSGEIQKLGVRSFEEPVEDKTRESKNAKRRAARGLRRNLFRRAMRKQSLKQILMRNQLAPSEPTNEQHWFDLDPYELRSRGITEKLSLQEFGRILYHLGQRRGFLSNRKTKLAEKVGIPEIDNLIELDEQAEIERNRSKPDKKTEDGPVLSSIANLSREIENADAPTIGDFFHKELRNNQKVRSRHTLRAMFIEEFEKLWDQQSSHYPEKLTDPMKAQVHKAIFHQRPLKDQSKTRAKCQLEPDKQVTYRAHPLFQEMRIWQTLNDIVLTETKNWTRRTLTHEEKQKIAQILQTASKPVTSKGLSWEKFRTTLKLSKKDQLLINFEQGKNHPVLEANETNKRLEQNTNGEWLHYSEETRLFVMDILFESSTDADKLRRLVKEANIHPEHAYKIVITPLPEGTANYSLRAIRNILPHLKEGLNHYKARIAAGYTPEHEKEHGEDSKLLFQNVPDARNPGVNKCLHEARKLINAIIRKYGKPDKIVIELGRDLALNKEAKKGILKQNNENKKLNDEAREKFSKYNPNSNPSRIDIIKYGLWVECDGQCPYTGNQIPLTELWTKSWEIEHIIPFSISLDDSFNNKTLAPSEVNAKKGNRLPSEYFASNPQDWNDALARVQKFKSSNHKKKLFRYTREQLPEDFISRQLNDTRYASRLVRDYVKTLGIEVASATGKHTADLRRHWALHNILDESGEKNREDHRHHAIDALVTALTTPAFIKRISDLNKSGGSLQHPSGSQRFQCPPPWPTLRQDTITAVQQIIVSHEPQHKIRGALHEETGYGVWSQDKTTLTTRKALASLTPGEIIRIVDPNLQQMVINALAAEKIPIGPDDLPEEEDEGTPKASKSKTVKWTKEQKNTAQQILDGFSIVDRNGELHPVVRVKITARGQDRSRYFQTNRGLFPSGNNQWLLIIEKIDSKERDAIIVPLWQAAKLKHQKLGPETLIPDGFKLLFVLHKQDMIYLTDGSGPFRVRMFSAENPVYLVLNPHDQAGDRGQTRIRARKDLQKLNPPLRIGMLGPEP